ncbi:MAG: DEAD/DEAH box helicase family protein [Acidobacteria bacterium]|nr:DEAD/DEAH box helicase family protein [Acidobacteriota bacterium]
MSLTDYHAKYFAYELTKRFSSDNAEKLAKAVASAQVDLNPHQVEAALFAFSSPLSQGALLADEVGLGKTIEAGLVISQRWAERKRRILVITPANLRKQWHQELSEKFFLPCAILETKSYNQVVKQGNFRPFEIKDTIIICSYQFARTKAADIHNTNWDLVVIDEAHRLRNVYKPSNVIANVLKKALAEKRKLLLTATPLQNSLLELYGLVSFIDEHAFGDVKSFREQFASANTVQGQSFQTLKDRLKPICHRTLRRQVTAYVPYTNRHAMVEPFDPDESETRLYDLVSEYLRRDNIQALPASQRTLMTLVLRKLLASSTFAIAGALNTISTRLKAKLGKQEPKQPLADELDEDYETLDETAEEWPEEQDDAEPLSEADRAAIEAELADLEQFTTLATSIQHNAKGTALLKALKVAFAEAVKNGAEQKAIIFTESRRTQDYLLRLLADSPYAEGVVLFNGSNTDDRSKQIYNAWQKRHQGTDRVTGSRTADMRSALVDYFREEGRIMIATEAGAEGINLQFCALVVNYDLPWNPQRIEQRIGRCHRYGQKRDVVVLNFLNQKNEADQRVYQLLSEKFKLFDRVFGSSDEVLGDEMMGAIESGVDFEKRIADIYQRCRHPEEIKAAFDQLQEELKHDIDEAMKRTRQQLLENFDNEVREKLKVRDETAKAQLNRFEQLLMQLTRHELDGHAEFLSDSAFRLSSNPFPQSTEEIPLGLYELPRRSGEAHLYRLQHPLAENVLMQALDRELSVAQVVFDYAQRDGRISDLESLQNQSGWLSLTMLSVEALNQAEDHLIFSAVKDSGEAMDAEQARKLFLLPGKVVHPTGNEIPAESLAQLATATQAELMKDISARNARYFEDEIKKLDAWADDQIATSEKELKDIKKRIRELRNTASKSADLTERLRLQDEISDAERRQRKMRQEIFEVEDRINAKRDELVNAIRGQLQQNIATRPLFSIRWALSSGK